MTDKVNQRQKTSRPLVIRGIVALKQAANSQKNKTGTFFSNIFHSCNLPTNQKWILKRHSYLRVY